jgi:Alpha-tubulin suppressor and related RCC1 domain-containing proteins
MRFHRLLAATALSATLLLPVVAQEDAFFRLSLTAPLLGPGGGSGSVDTEDPGVPGGSPNNPDPEPLPVSVTLAEHSFSPFTVGDSIDHDFSGQLAVANGEASDVAWSVGSPSNLPVGPGLTGGVLSGEFDQAGEFDFELVATHPDAVDPARQVYTIVVNGVTLRVTQIATASHRSCAITVSGGVKCWGHNGNGQLGDGTTTHRHTPVDVVGLTSGVTAIDAGNGHTCAIHNGAAKCWGYNSSGRLGDGTSTQRTIPVDVVGLGSDVTGIAVGLNHTCAIHNGAAKCWGFNGDGQLGDNSTTQRNTPIQVSALTSGVTSIDAGYYHTCATHNGAAKCWGSNTYGQLGDNSTDDRYVPVPVTGLGSNVTSIVAADSHTCAIHNGAAKCWGNNGKGKLGDNSTALQRNVPVSVSGLGFGVTSIASGGSHTCAIHNGAAKCWGHNNKGQLGDGTTTDQGIPVSVGGLGAGVTSIDGGSAHTCAIQDSVAKCWGSNPYGQLGDGTTTDQGTPVEVSGL